MKTQTMNINGQNVIFEINENDTAIGVVSIDGVTTNHEYKHCLCGEDITPEQQAFENLVGTANLEIDAERNENSELVNESKQNFIEALAQMPESESLQIIEILKASATPLVTMQLAIEQGDYKHVSDFTFNDIPNIEDVANIALNEAYGFLAINKMLKSGKNRPSMAKEFTFSLAFEQGDKSAILSDFSTKVTFGEKAQNKLIKNMPYVIAQMLVSKTIPAKERLQALANPKAIKLQLA